MPIGRRFSARARWIALGAVLVVAGLAAAIPAFIGGSPSRAPAPARTLPSWLAGLTQRQSVLATASNGEQLLAHRQRGFHDYVCFTLGTGGGGTCGPVSPSVWERPLVDKRIAVIGRTRDRRGIGWWGLVGDGVTSIRAVYARGSRMQLRVSRGFVVFGDRANPPRSVIALDADGAALGRVNRSDPATIECSPSECSTLVVAQG
jgi:hypothetical protein